MAAVLQLIFLVVVLAALRHPVHAEEARPAAPDRPDIRTEEGLRRILDPLETRYETACVKMNEAMWRAATEERGADASGLEAARKELAAVYTDPALDEIFAVWSQRNTVTRDATLSRRVNLWHRSREVAGVELDPAIFSLTGSLASRLRGHRFALEGRQVSRAELDRIIATSPDRQTRERAWLAEGAFAAEVKTDVSKLIRLRAVKAQGTKQRYFHHLVYGGSEIDAYWAYGLMDQLAARSKARYATLLQAMKASLGQESLEPWDLEYALNKRTSQRGLDKAIAASFPPGGALPAARRLLDALGFDPNSIPIRASAADLGFGGALGRAVRIPADIRIAADGSGDSGGPRFYEAVLREHGRALQSAFNKQPSPMLKGYECVDGTRNEVYAEGMAEALGSFVRDPIFLEKLLGMDRKSIELYLEDESDRALVRLRELLLNMGIEFAFYVNPDADLDERYRSLLSRSMGVNAAAAPVVWPSRISFVTTPSIDLDRLIALSIAPEVHARLKEAFGDNRLGSGKTAPWLIEHCFADGELTELQMRLSNSIQGGMDFEKYLDSLGATHAPTARH